MLGDPECEWAYGCWRPGDIVLEPCVSYTHARKLTEDGGVVYRHYAEAEAWVKVVEHGPVDVIGLDTDDMYPTILWFNRRPSWWR